MNLIYYFGQEPLRKKCSSHHSQQNSPKYNLKNDRKISVHFQGKPLNITVIQVYAQTSNDEEAEVEWFCEDLQDILEPTLKMDVEYGQQKQDRELTVAQIMNSLLPNSDLN